jgi:hypothetical protein
MYEFCHGLLHLYPSFPCQMNASHHPIEAPDQHLPHLGESLLAPIDYSIWPVL